jgi:hypothetical protein
MKQTSYIGFILLAGFAMSGCTSCTKEVSVEEFIQYQNNPLNDTVWSTSLKATDAVNTIVTDLMPPVEKETLNLENTPVIKLNSKTKKIFIKFLRFWLVNFSYT